MQYRQSPREGPKIRLLSQLHLTNYCSRLPVPTLVTYNKTSYELENEILEEADIGPEVTHIYQVLNKLLPVQI